MVSAHAKISPSRLMLPSAFSNSNPGQWQRIMLFGFGGGSRGDWSLTVVGC